MAMRALIVLLGSLSIATAGTASQVGSVAIRDGTDIELYSQLADLRALALVCDTRNASIVRRSWESSGFEDRRARISQELIRRYGEAAVTDAEEVHVFGCFGVSGSQEARRDYSTILSTLETRLR